jgi:glycosyltransferase involved in cell wall biosynthesis
MIFASDAEGMGIVLPEAMASGVPIVAAKLRNAVAEIISDGVDGFVVEGVDLEALADRVERVLDDAELRSRMIGNARAKALNGFTMERNAQQVYQLYKEVCAHG